MQTLEARCPKAASLREGLEETLILHKLGVAKLLRDRLRTTNMIESINGGLAHTTRRVIRWCNLSQRQRRIAAACMDIEEHSRNAIPQDWQWDGLLRALKRHGKTKNAILYPDKASGNFLTMVHSRLSWIGRKSYGIHPGFKYFRADVLLDFRQCVCTDRSSRQWSCQ